jgi:hypothetical protein
MQPLVTFQGLLAIACALSFGCSGHSTDRSTARRSSVAVGADSIPLDSCVALDRLARPQNRVFEPGDSLPPPHPGSWTAVKRLSLGAFSIEPPAGTTLGRRDSLFVAVLDFPTCRYFCALDITLIRDSISRSLDDYVASLRVVDTAKNADAADWIPGPPRSVALGSDRGLAMETPCGDCTSAQVIVRRGNTVAHIGYSLDDRDGYHPGVMCRLARVATTFRWIEGATSISTRSFNER